MIRPVRVIASFNMYGTATPLYFSMSHDPNAPIYKVKVLHKNEDLLGSYTATYYCSTMVNGQETELQLIFVAHSHIWSLVISNSRARALI